MCRSVKSCKQQHMDQMPDMDVVSTHQVDIEASCLAKAQHTDPDQDEAHSSLACARDQASPARPPCYWINFLQKVPGTTRDYALPTLYMNDMLAYKGTVHDSIAVPSILNLAYVCTRATCAEGGLNAIHACAMQI